MVIGIHAIAVFKEKRTGIEEYAYRLIKHIAMLPESKDHRFILYTNKSYVLNNLPGNFEIRILRWPIMWTQIRLSMEILKKECDVLFIPAHVLPIIHPKNSVVTIHGLEYEYFPQHYPYWFRKYLWRATKYSTKNAKKIITVSENTKRDLMKLYGVDENKIKVVYHGIKNSKFKIQNSKLQCKMQNYILYIGRIETKKNAVGIIKAFEIFKRKYKLSHKLVLAGPSGFGYQTIKFRIQNSEFKTDIIEMGFISEIEKEYLYNNASLFLFPSFYEGFGMPIVEAQERGVPVITSNVSSMPEVGGQGALYVNPNDYGDIADKMYALLTNEKLRQDMINQGYKNSKRFSWEKCARETLDVLLSLE